MRQKTLSLLALSKKDDINAKIKSIVKNLDKETIATFWDDLSLASEALEMLKDCMKEEMPAKSKITVTVDGKEFSFTHVKNADSLILDQAKAKTLILDWKDICSRPKAGSDYILPNIK